MRFKWPPFTFKKTYLFDWHPWFAWYPVHISGDNYVWLEWIERVGDEHYTGILFNYRLKSQQESRKFESGDR